MNRCRIDVCIDVVWPQTAQTRCTGFPIRFGLISQSLHMTFTYLLTIVRVWMLHQYFICTPTFCVNMRMLECEWANVCVSVCVWRCLNVWIEISSIFQIHHYFYSLVCSYYLSLSTLSISLGHWIFCWFVRHTTKAHTRQRFDQTQIDQTSH